MIIQSVTSTPSPQGFGNWHLCKDKCKLVNPVTCCVFIVISSLQINFGREKSIDLDTKSFDVLIICRKEEILNWLQKKTKQVFFWSFLCFDIIFFVCVFFRFLGFIGMVMLLCTMDSFLGFLLWPEQEMLLWKWLASVWISLEMLAFQMFRFACFFNGYVKSCILII